MTANVIAKVRAVLRLALESSATHAWRPARWALLISGLLLAQTAWAQAITFNVSNLGAPFTFTPGGTNPTLTLQRGRTYDFVLNTSPVHPFFIKLTFSAAGPDYNSGVGGAGNGAFSGTLSFTVPEDAPDTLYYVCGIHGEGGIINIVDAPRAQDFDGDGKSDVLWRNLSTGENYLYPMNGKTILGTEGYLRTVADLNWKMAGFGDFDGDGKADVLWRNSSTGQNYVYLMNGKVIAGEGYIRTVADQNWQVAGTGDVDGDGKADILWRNFATGENYVYPMNGLAIKATEGYLRTVASQNWQVAGMGDFDGDGKADILWRNSVSGENYLYPMDALAIKAGEGYLRTVADLNWQVAGVGRFDADARSDILWRNRLTGENYLYLMNGKLISGEGYLRTVADLDWQVAAVGDYDGDGRSDILWRNTTTGSNYLYPMNGLAIKATEGYLRSVANQDWHVAGSPARHAIDAVRPSCDAALASNSSDPADYAKAIDLCRTAKENAPLAERGWGLISAALVRADGTGAPHVSSRSIRPSFGANNLPGFGNALAVLSTGRAAASGQANPSFAAFQPGTDHAIQSAFPADWLAANGGVRPVAPGCPAASDGTVALDPVMLKLRIRVPSNARSFSVRARLFSADYPEYVCSPYNDYFLVLLDSAAAGGTANPADKNLSFDANGIPVGINSTYRTACVNGATGCAFGATPGGTSACTGTAALQGTGFDIADAGVCGVSAGMAGGGTSWFDVRGNVVPGETIELRFALWDTGDGSFDTLVLLDDWRWSKQSVEPGTILAD